MKSIFDYNSYRLFLRDCFPQKGEARGRRKFLAEHLKCQLSLIGLVLTERAHFSEEMLCEVAEFLRLTESEREFFLLLGSFERAGSHKLRSVYEKRIRKLRQEYCKFEEAVKSEAETELSTEVLSEYYGNWLNVAIQTAVLIPEMITIERLQHLFMCSRDQIEAAVQFLVQNGLIRREKGRLSPGVRRLHFKRASSMIPLIHTTWRLEATRHLHSNKDSNLHFSGAYSVSRSDYERIKTVLQEALVSCEKVVAPSKDECLIAIGLDLWRY
ncbi:MAG: TIGR02147 family protein [Bdellovibrionia bacterium]